MRGEDDLELLSFIWLQMQSETNMIGKNLNYNVKESQHEERVSNSGVLVLRDPIFSPC